MNSAGVWLNRLFHLPGQADHTYWLTRLAAAKALDAAKTREKEEKEKKEEPEVSRILAKWADKRIWIIPSCMDGDFFVSRGDGKPPYLTCGGKWTYCLATAGPDPDRCYFGSRYAAAKAADESLTAEAQRDGQAGAGGGSRQGPRGEP